MEVSTPTREDMEDLVIVWSNSLMNWMFILSVLGKSSH
jgi:hypothetical protein